MFDTLRVQWRGIALNDDMENWLRCEYPTAQFSTAAYSETQPWRGVYLSDAKLGRIGLKSSRIGNALTAECSIPKYAYDDNTGLFSASQALEAASDWVRDVQDRFAGWWELPGYSDTAEVKRIDLCYQQPVPSSSQVFPYIHAALKASRATLYEMGHKQGSTGSTSASMLQTHLSGVSYNQSREEHARWYDKGIESGNERYLNIVRHEEEIKGGKAGVVAAILSGRVYCDRDLARNWMNGRYQGWGEGEAYDLQRLLLTYGTQGAAALGLVIAPEHEPLYKQCLPKTTFYRVKALAMEARRLRVPLDLRLPEDAWLEPMVL